MRLVYFGNNRLGLEVLRHLVDTGDAPAAVVLNPPERRARGEEFLVLASQFGIPVYDAALLQDDPTMGFLGLEPPLLGLSVLFGQIFRPATLGQFTLGIANLHPSLLPHNRGAHPNVWCLVEGSPAGASLHWVDAGVDTGDIIAQQEVRVDMTDTGASLYRKLEQAALQLFIQHWPAVRSGTAPRRAQTDAGRAHRMRDLERLDRIDPDRSYRAGDLINILRARTFPPHRGAYIEQDGQRFYLRLQLLREEDLQ